MRLERFNEIWASSSYPPAQVTEADLRAVERRFDVRLPAEYREAVLRVGLPRPAVALMDVIVERELDMHAVGDFYSPAEIIEETIGWRQIGMPEALVAFASDGCGNMFCFDAHRLNGGTADAHAVLFYDHDFDTVDQVAPSFDAWIEAFCRLEPTSEPETD